jgi:hypothetical protein
MFPFVVRLASFVLGLGFPVFSRAVDVQRGETARPVGVASVAPPYEYSGFRREGAGVAGTGEFADSGKVYLLGVALFAYYSDLT